MVDYVTEAEHKTLQTAQDLRTLVEVAITILKRMHATGQKIVQVCGPMTTGGLDNYEKNMVVFRNIISKAQTNSGYLVFNQDLFTEAIIRMTEARADKEYWMGLIDDFYGEIFRSGYFYGTLWIKGWEGSKGAVREREIAKECGMVMEDCPSQWYN